MDLSTQAMDAKKRKPTKAATSLKEVVSKSPSTTGSSYVFITHVYIVLTDDKSQETKKEDTVMEVVGKSPPTNKGSSYVLIHSCIHYTNGR